MRQEDGMIVIGTTINDSEFYKKIKEFEKVKDYSIEINPEFDVKKLQKEILEANAELQKYKGLEVLSEDDLLQVQMLVDYVDAANQRISELGGTQIIIKGLNDAEASLEQIEESARKIDLSYVEKQLGNVGNSITKVIKKIAKWSLAIFGIRSAYMGVRNAINTIAGEDEQLKADIDYMKNAIAYALEPIVRSIVNFAKQLMFYISYIVKAWTGINIFENANKSLKNANKQAKQLKKTLSSFDEMNILNDDGSVSSTTSPSFDLTAPENVEPPAWIQWIANNKDIVIGALAGITAGLIALDVLGLKPIIATGIGVLIAGVVMLIQDIIKLIKDPSWQGFANILGDIAIIIGGVMMIAMKSWWGLLVAIVGLAVKLIADNWDTIMNILSTVGGWIYDNITKPVGDFFSGLWNGIVNGVKTAFNTIKGVFNSIVSFFSGIVSSILNLFKTIGTNVGNVIGSAFKAVVNAVLGAIESILNFPIKAINGLISVINAIPGINIGKLSTFKLPRLAKGGIVNMPGRGINYAGANMGEKGPEGVIPLTDAQQMQLLGEAIGRYVNISATIPVYVGTRQIAREVRNIEAEDNFAFNGG